MSVAVSHAPMSLMPLRRAWLGLFRWALRLSDTIAIARDHDQRGARIAALYALSDVELAAKGLRRDQVVQHVYADLLAL